MAFSRWLDAARRGLPLRIFGSPARTRDVTDVHDVVRALGLLVEFEVTGPVNIGTGQAHRLDDLARVVAEITGARLELRVVPADPDEVSHTRADTTLLRRLTGFVPHTNLRELFARQYAAAQAGAPITADR